MKTLTALAFITALTISTGKAQAMDITLAELGHNLTNADSAEPVGVNLTMRQAAFAIGTGYTTIGAYVKDNLEYPKEAFAKGIEGKVRVKFSIEPDGVISGAMIVYSDHDVLNAEALRVVEKMPKWNPAAIGTLAVKSTQIIDISFRMR